MSRNAWMHFYVVFLQDVNRHVQKCMDAFLCRKKNCDPVTDAHTLQSNKAPYNT